MISYLILPATLAPFYLMPPSNAKAEGVAAPVADTRTVIPDDERQQIAIDILGETKTFWSAVFQRYGLVYEPPAVVFFHGVAYTACARIPASLFYCPSDRKLYIDTAFFQEMSELLGMSGGYTQAFLIAHQIGNHVQNELGILPNFKQVRQQFGGEVASKMSVRAELQADCFAGMWGVPSPRTTVLVNRCFSHKHSMPPSDSAMMRCG